MNPARMLLVAAALILVLFTALQGCAGPEVGLTPEGRLAPCPDRPNCVCSDGESSEGSFISPIAIPEGEAPEAAFGRLLGLVAERARVERHEGDWAHAVFTTRILRFRDDVELRLDRDAGVIQVRSASRVGYSDLGKNRSRIEGLRKAFVGGAPR